VRGEALSIRIPAVSFPGIKKQKTYPGILISDLLRFFSRSANFANGSVKSIDTWSLKPPGRPEQNQNDGLPCWTAPIPHRESVASFITIQESAHADILGMRS